MGYELNTSYLFDCDECETRLGHAISADQSPIEVVEELRNMGWVMFTVETGPYGSPIVEVLCTKCARNRHLDTRGVVEVSARIATLRSLLEQGGEESK